MSTKPGEGYFHLNKVTEPQVVQPFHPVRIHFPVYSSATFLSHLYLPALITLSYK